MPRSASKSTTSAAKGAISIGIVMGSQSDWETMQHTANLLQSFDISFETKIISAHRTPKRLYDYAATAAGRGLQLIIAGAGGAAHLPGMMAAITHVPVLGVPVQSKTLDGLDSLLSIAQMPAGIPVGTLAVGKAGAINAGLLTVAILARGDKELDRKLRAWRRSQTDAVGLIPVDEDYVPGKKTSKGRKKK